MSSFPEWSKPPPAAEPARPDVDAVFGPAAQWPAYPAPTYPAPTYPAPTGARPGTPPEPPVPPRLNALAVVAFVLAFVVPPAAIVLGVIARGRIRRDRESGQGLATAAIALGAVFAVLGVVAAGLLVHLLLTSSARPGDPTPAAASGPAAAAPPPYFAAADLARDLTRQLARSGTGAHDAGCPRDLLGVPGQSVRCTVVSVDGQPTDIVVTVTAVRDGAIDYRWRPEARPIIRALLERRVTELLAQQTGRAPLSTACAGDLPPVVDARVDCAVTLSEGVRRVTVTTTGNAGGQVSLSITPK